jgi:predicted TIM-barrel fold metal-dependent hydrolase
VPAAWAIDTIIDFSAHLISRVALGKILETRHYYGPDNSKYDLPYPPQNATARVRIALMDKYGIDMQLLSQTTPVLMGFGSKDAANICTLSNDSIAELCHEYPTRFVGAAIVSLLDIGTALDELDRAVKDLGFKCVTISTNQNGKGLDSHDYYPFYERVINYNIPLFLHPTHWDSYPLVDMKEGWRMMHVFGWPFDTTQAVWRLIFGGVLDKFSDLKVITHHLGAMLPYFSRRIELNVQSFLQDKLSRPLSEYWKQIYGDSAVDGTAAALPCGYAFFGGDRMLFGSDYPFGPEAGEIFIKDNLAAIMGMAIPETDREKILGKNARRLLKIG